MKPSRFAEEQIIGILREREAGTATADICRKHAPIDFLHTHTLMMRVKWLRTLDYY
jgi:hypothetical protein